MNNKAYCRFLILLTASFCCLAAAGQRPGTGTFSPNPTRERFGDNTLTFQVVPAFFGGYGLEYSRNVSGQKHWVKVNAAVYAASNFSSSHLNSREKMLGYSVGAHHQYHYFELTDVGFRMFFQWGLDYTALDLRNVAKAETHIEKLGLDLAVGFRQNIAKPLYFEFYIGYGQRWLTKTRVDSRNVLPSVTDLEIREPRYDSHIFDYGRGGSVLVLGFNIGFLF